MTSKVYQLYSNLPHHGPEQRSGFTFCCAPCTLCSDWSSWHCTLVHYIVYTTADTVYYSASVAWYPPVGKELCILGKDYSFLCSFSTSFNTYILYLESYSCKFPVTSWLPKISQPKLSSFANKLDGGISRLQPPSTQNATSTFVTFLFIIMVWNALIYSYLFYCPWSCVLLTYMYSHTGTSQNLKWADCTLQCLHQLESREKAVEILK